MDTNQHESEKEQATTDDTDSADLGRARGSSGAIVLREDGACWFRRPRPKNLPFPAKHKSGPKIIKSGSEEMGFPR